MKNKHIGLGLLFGLCSPVLIAGNIPAPYFCINGDSDKLCSKIPHNAHPNIAGYSGLSEAGQRPFDTFSWQIFTALNWPADSEGHPLDKTIGTAPSAPRVWQSYPTPAEMFGGDKSSCDNSQNLPVFLQAAKNGNTELANEFLEPDHRPLIDSQLNFVVYDIRLNDVEANYIKAKGLDTLAGQKAFVGTKGNPTGNKVSFPMGYYDDPEKRTGGKIGAIELKTSWRVLDPKKDDLNRYYTVDGLISVAAENTQSGKPLCAQETLGLVGMHIIERTQGDGAAWIWSTFEHVDNAPIANKPLAPTITQLPTDETIAEYCSTPTDIKETYSFFNPNCKHCQLNTQAKNQASNPYLWADTPPYAANYAVDGKYGTQVARCFEIYNETAELNKAWQAKLAGTAWENYMLINTQWQLTIDAPPFSKVNVPTYLSNTTMETYIQTKSVGSCITCHDFASIPSDSSPQTSANFSFLLNRAK